MNAGKSTSLLQSNHNYKVRNLQTYLFTPKVDADFHEGNIHSRLGVQHKANIFDDKFNFFEQKNLPKNLWGFFKTEINNIFSNYSNEFCRC